MNYSDRIFLAISQNARFGTLVREREKRGWGRGRRGPFFRPTSRVFEGGVSPSQSLTQSRTLMFLSSQPPDISQVRRQRSPARRGSFLRRERAPRPTRRSLAPHLRPATGGDHQQVFLPTTLAFHFPAGTGSGHVRKADGMGEASAVSLTDTRKAG